MNKNLWMGLLAVLLLALGGCGGEATVQPEGAETMGAGEMIDGRSQAELLSELRVYFAFDSSSLDAEARTVVKAHAAHLVANPNLTVTLEGHCDERGTREYNLALGERRAEAVARLMRALGVSSDRITTISYGEEKPVALAHNESAWRQNRRVEIKY